MLEQRVGKMLSQQAVHICEGHIVKGDMTDEFTDAIMDVISKGVLYYTNLPPTGSPQNKRKGEVAHET
jgi:hypothetical protein